MEIVLPEEVDVTPEDGRQARDVRRINGDVTIGKVAQGFLHIDGVPMDDRIESQAKSAKSLAQRASDFAAVAHVDAP
jgi:hypothetical protein